jgi:hypothetical protein
MFAGVVQIVCGDVVASGASVYVVQSIEGDELTVLRIESQKGVRHRADVTPEHWSDVALSGLPLQDVVVRCVPVRRYGTCNLTKLGCLSEALRARIEVALRREMLVRRFEDSPPMRSNLMASTSSRGRRVGAVRYA